MAFFYFDSSALVKRYVSEIGTPLVNYLCAKAPMSKMMCLVLSIGEVVSVFVRKKNGGQITEDVFYQALASFRFEVVGSEDFNLVPVDTNSVLASLSLIEAHAINAFDAVVLSSVLELSTKLRDAGDNLVLITSDKRLERAGKANGVSTFNPETDAQSLLDASLDG